ncbi:hypothetical protein BASA60_007434 [Batrachochytrium salamandrivorans]|nr:hypothetical protein BASA62_004639 [Batrachochytrium salamandrivorans]KAH6571004.1 hypothetical protein BASA60_007434 [Batrachochytrium salamandrivorans]
MSLIVPTRPAELFLGLAYWTLNHLMNSTHVQTTHSIPKYNAQENLPPLPIYLPNRINSGQLQESHMQPVVIHTDSLSPSIADIINPASVVSIDYERASMNDQYTFSTGLDKATQMYRQAIMEDYTNSRLRWNAQHHAALDIQSNIHGNLIKTLKTQLECITDSRDQHKKKLDDYVQVVSAVTVYLTSKRDVLSSAKFFCKWRTRVAETRRLKLALHTAVCHFKRTLLRKSITGWHCVAGVTWKKATEKIIRLKAEKQLKLMSMEYESRIAELSMKLSRAHIQLSSLQKEQRTQQEDMKRSFFRGVCALNMETMGIFCDDRTEVPTDFGNVPDPSRLVADIERVDPENSSVRFDDTSPKGAKRP